MKVIEVELEQYKELVSELEILVKIGEVIMQYEELNIGYKETLEEIARLVFKEK